MRLTVTSIPVRFYRAGMAFFREARTVEVDEATGAVLLAEPMLRVVVEPDELEPVITAAEGETEAAEPAPEIDAEKDEAETGAPDPEAAAEEDESKMVEELTSMRPKQQRQQIKRK